MSGENIQNNSHNSASFFVEAQAVVTAWTEVAFTDYNGAEMLAGHVLMEETTGFAVEYSFDPGVIKVVAGKIAGNQQIQLNWKHATSVWVRRAEGADTTMNISAWR